MPRSNPISIDWKPDKDSPTPVSQQIVGFLREKIASGAWSIGTRLPAQRQLAEQFGVNRSTVTGAMEELISYGMLEGCRGAGTRVASNTWSLFLSPAADWSRFLSAGSFQANSRIVQAINRLEFAPGMTRLGTGEPDPRLFPTERWQKVLAHLSQRVTSLGYLEPLGSYELRQALSHYLKTLGIEASPSCILITSGALQALQLISVCLLRPGSVVLTEAPTYLKSLQVFQSAGSRLVGVPMDAHGLCYWDMAPRLPPNRGTASAILYTIPTNQNPTGITMPNERRQALMDFCADHRLPIIEDGAYHELCYDGSLPHPLKALDTTGSVLYLGSASKTLAPGLRLGWLVAPEPIVQRLGDVKMQMDYGASSLSQLALTEFLNRGFYSDYLDELRAELRTRRDHALDVLKQEFPDLATWNTPSGGFYIWLTCRFPLPAHALFESAVKEGILLNPGDLYDFSHNHSLRLSYAYTTCDEFKQGAKKLAALLRRFQNTNQA